MARPVMVYDGDCGFCRRWILRWQAMTGEAVEYRASRDPGLRAVRWEGPGGATAEGAEAVFKALEHAPWPGRLWLQAYRGVPGFASISEAAYRLVADHRVLFSRLTHLLWGRDVTPPTFHVGRRLFLSGLALCYVIAFVSFAVQARGLVGPAGIAPAGASEAALLAVSWGGTAAALALLLGIAPIFSAAACWLLYQGVFAWGGLFLGFQWDALLLEAGFIAILAAPWKGSAPASSSLWLIRWLWFRLMLLSGLVKLASGDPAWSSLTALEVHYETQPLPHVLSWYAHHLPGWFQRLCCAAMFAVELVLPWAVFLPRRPRLAAFVGVNALMVLIILTGNYTFFNLLAVALSFVLLDDSVFGRSLQGASDAPAAQRRAAAAFLAFAVPVGLAAGWARTWPGAGEAARSVASLGRPLALVNSYGLFAVMTRPRREIVLEGSRDGREWKTYEFKWKPGDPERRPGWVQPHQPRLDWQMWFAALSPYQHNAWYLAFMKRLLEGSPEVSDLLRKDPFRDGEPPKYLRSLFFEYRFTTPEGRRETGAWWKRELLGLYAPVVTLTPAGELAAVTTSR